MIIKQELLAAAHGIITQARERAVRSVDTERVLMYWHLGQLIFEEQQQGADRAAYGSSLIKGLAAELQPQFGSGFSGRQLPNATGSFTAPSQMRPHCGRNSAGCTTKRSSASTTRTSANFTWPKRRKTTGRPGSWSGR